MKRTENPDYSNKNNEDLENTNSEGNCSRKGDLNELFQVPEKTFPDVRLLYIGMNCLDILRNLSFLKFLRTGQIFPTIGLEMTNSTLEVREGRKEGTFECLLLFSVN